MRWRTTIALVGATASLLVPETSSAGASCWRGSAYARIRTLDHCRYFNPFGHRGADFALRRMAPARTYSAFYYQSKGGIGHTYSTTAYSTDGYARRYRW